MSDYPSATGRAQDSESTPAKDRRSTAELRSQHYLLVTETDFLYLCLGFLEVRTL